MAFNMKIGCLIWDSNAQRPDIKYQDGTYYGGLHCGNTLDALIRNEWQPTRIEYCMSTDTWFLAGIENGSEILWLPVRN
jgi:hypothetical protein